MTATLTEHDRPDTRDMVFVHNAFRTCFGDLPGLVRAVADGDIARARVLTGFFTELADGLHHHHTNEDDYLWPLLSSRLAEAGTEVDAAFVERAEAQHERVAGLLEAARPACAAFHAGAGAAQREAFAALLGDLDAALREHMADEEAYILPLAEAHLTAPEWEVLGERGRAGLPKDRLLIQLGFILDGLPVADQAELLAHLPLPARIAWRVVGRRRYRRERARIWGALS